MGAVARYAIDTSALARSGSESIASIVNPLIQSGLAATCAPLDFEALFSAQSLSEYRSTRALRRTVFEYLPSDDRDWDRAFEVQAQLAEQGRLREVGMADLLTAAIAERHRVTLLHYDSDFDTIASVTGQDARWVVPRGSVA